MRDEDEGRPLPERPDPREEHVDLRPLQHRGRLVEEDHQMPARRLLQRQRLGDLHHLPRGEVEVVRPRPRIDVELHLRELPRGVGVEPPPVHDAGAGELRLVAEVDVLAHRQVGQQRLLLEDHADALAVGIGRILQPRRLARDQDPPGVRLVDPAQDLHQRRLARAVLADQPDDLAGPDLDRHALQRLHAGKALVHVLERRARRRRPRSLHHPHLAPVDGERHRDDDHQPLHADLHAWRHPHQHHAVREHHHDQHPHQRLHHAALAARERGAADHHRGDGGEEPARCRSARCRARAAPPRGCRPRHRRRRRW